MPDHVRLFAKAPLTLAPHYIVQQLKGISSRLFRQESHISKVASQLPGRTSKSSHADPKDLKVPSVSQSAESQIGATDDMAGII